MNLSRLSRDELKSLKADPVKLRSYCVGRKVSLIDVLDQIDALISDNVNNKSKDDKLNISRLKRRISVCAPRNIYRVIRKVNAEYREKRFSYGSITLEDFAKRVDFDLEKNDLKVGVETTFSGFVANRLYDTIVLKKYHPKDKKRRKRIKKKVPEHLRKIKDEDFSKFLWITFDSVSMELVRGKLPENYVADNYRMINEEIVLLKGNEMVKHPSIEGTRNWVDPSKDETRKMITNYIDSYLLNNLRGKAEVVETTLTTIISERGKIEERINKLNEEIRDMSEKKRYLIFSLEGPNYRVNQFVKNILGGRSKSANLSGRKVIEDTIATAEGFKRKVDVTFDLRIVSLPGFDTFVKGYKEFINSLPENERGSLNSNLDTILRNGILSENLIASKDNEISLCQRELDKLTLKESEISQMRNSPKNLNYLGLEGPNFSSFLKIYGLLSKYGIGLKGVIPENSERLYNLMNSLARHDNFREYFRDVKIARADLDELILLDFVNSPLVRLEREPTKDEDLKLGVRYKEDLIGLDQYYLALDSLETEGVEKTSKKFGISPEFASIISDRYKDKFDIVFLDYVGRMTSKRQLALEVLVRRRLNSNAIIATTTNASARVNPRGESGGMEQINNNILEISFDAFINNGYTPIEREGLEYNKSKSASDGMIFQVYYIKKDQV